MPRHDHQATILCETEKSRNPFISEIQTLICFTIVDFSGKDINVNCTIVSFSQSSYKCFLVAVDEIEIGHPARSDSGGRVKRFGAGPSFPLLGTVESEA